MYILNSLSLRFIKITFLFHCCSWSPLFRAETRLIENQVHRYWIWMEWFFRDAEGGVLISSFEAGSWSGVCLVSIMLPIYSTIWSKYKHRWANRPIECNGYLLSYWPQRQPNYSKEIDKSILSQSGFVWLTSICSAIRLARLTYKVLEMIHYNNVLVTKGDVTKKFTKRVLDSL